MAKRETKIPDWSQLPPELIEAIANRLGAVEDFAAFAAVCTSWRSSAQKERWNPSVHRLPWLLLTGDHNSGESQPRWFWSLHRNKNYNLNLPTLNHAIDCWGSPSGWVFTQGHDYTTRLVNPLTRVQITLPPSPFYIQKAFVFERTNVIVVVAILRHTNGLILSGPGLEEWVPIQDHDRVNHVRGRIKDVVCYKNRVFAIRFDGTLVLCEIDGPHPSAANFAGPLAKDNYRRIYLIESSGNLLMALEYSPRRGFEVHRFNMESREWRKLEDLGGRTLFVGENNYSMSLYPINDIHCRGNCIYSTSLYHRNCRICFIKIFHVKEQRFENYPTFMDVSVSLSPHVWVMPSLC